MKDTDGGFVSLFSGAMGLDLGLEESGLTPLCCVENDPDSANSIRKNRPEVALIEDSVTNVDGKRILSAVGNVNSGTIPIVVGGPPCQSFSVFGNRLGIEDARGQLLFEFVRLVEELHPHAFLMENVRGMLSISIVPKSKRKEHPGFDTELFQKGSVYRRLVQEFNRVGYHVDCFVVNSANYGAPQIRERVFLIGNNFGQKAYFIQPTHSNRTEDKLLPFTTLGDAIGPSSGFEDPFPEVMDFSPRKLKYLSMIPPGGNWRSMPVEIQKESMGKSWHLKGGRSAYWRKLSFAFPSPTVVTMPNHAGTSMCHPTELRAISVGEAAAIQEFPRDWKFCGNTASKFRQIGNAVPERLAKIAGGVLCDLLDRRETSDVRAWEMPGHTELHIRPHVRTRTFYRNGKVFNGDVSYYDHEESNSESQFSFELE